MPHHAELNASVAGVHLQAVPGAFLLEGRLIQPADLAELRQFLEIAEAVAGDGDWERPNNATDEQETA